MPCRSFRTSTQLGGLWFIQKQQSLLRIESWLVASFQGLPATLGPGRSPKCQSRRLISCALSLTTGRAALVNGLVAGGASTVVANGIVGQTYGFRTPFILSGILLTIAWVIIGNVWDENYGAQKSTSSGGGELSKIAAGIDIVRRVCSCSPCPKEFELTRIYTQSLHSWSLALPKPASRDPCTCSSKQAGQSFL